MSKMKGIKFRVASQDASKMWKAVKQMKALGLGKAILKQNKGVIK